MDAASVSFKLSQATLADNASRKKATLEVGAQAQGFSASEHICGVSGSFTGAVRKTGSGYRATGVYTPYTDLYDFNLGGGRTFAEEVATGIGLAGGVFISAMSLLIVKPTDYYIYFDGSSRIDQSW